MEKIQTGSLLSGSTPQSSLYLVFEHFDRWGESAEWFLQEPAKKAKLLEILNQQQKFSLTFGSITDM